MKKTIFICLLLVFINCNNNSKTHGIFPKPIGYVSDFAELIDENSENIITDLCKNLNNKKYVQIAVCTIDSIPLVKKEYKNEMMYATDLFSEWGIGRKGKDDGLLILISKKDRKAVISTGYFTEQVLHDSTAGRILDKSMIPEFKNGEFGEGIIKGIKEIEKVIYKNLKLMYPDKYE